MSFPRPADLGQSARERRLNDLAAALAEADALAPEARQRARDEAMARYRAEQAADLRLTPTRTPKPTDWDLVLIAPPGFGPDPARPPK